MVPIIEFKDFSFKYRAQTESTLKDINLAIMPGEKVLIVGPSGSGKSTLAHCINGLVPFSYTGESTGVLQIAGKDPEKLGIFGLSKIVGTVLQDMLQIVQHLIDLIHFTLGKLMLNAHLIAVSLADRAILIRPRVPDVRCQITDVVGLFLVYPQYLVYRRAVVNAPQGHKRKFLADVIPVHHAEFLDGVRGSFVVPTRTDIHIRVGHAVFQNIKAIPYEDVVCSAHKISFRR